MLYLVDTANIAAIRKALNYYPISGVTTNPTIIAREGRGFSDVLHDIREVIGDKMMLHVQAVGLESESITSEAEKLQKVIGGNLYIKIPVIPEGIKAMMNLKKKGIKVTATAVFTAQQALMAAEAGAEFVAPYINRIESLGSRGADVVNDIIRLFKLNGLDTKVLAASFKNVRQVHEVTLEGADSVTLNPDILESLLNHPLTDSSVSRFVADWENIYGKGKLTVDLLKDSNE